MSNEMHAEEQSERESSIPNPSEYINISPTPPHLPSEASTSETVSLETQKIQELI